MVNAIYRVERAAPPKPLTPADVRRLSDLETQALEDPNQGRLFDLPANSGRREL